MKRKSRKIISIVLALMMVISCFAALNVSAATTDEVVSTALASVYQTNPNNATGKNASITIDGSFSDWTTDMKIAQSGAWDVANNWKGAHENCVLDTTGLYAAWDNQNLYVAWQMVNITDTFWREGDGPLSDGGRVLDVPLILALSVDPSSPSLNNQVVGESGKIWGVDIEFDTHVDHLFYMSGKPGLGTPAMFTVADKITGATNYTSACQKYAAAGIKYALAEGNIENKIMGLDGSQSTADVESDYSNWVDFKTHQGSFGVHNTKYDSFYEMSIPLSVLGIDANYLANNGIGAMIVASRGESGIDCTPYDLSMIDNATESYGSDSSTSKEKDDADVITSAFARIGAVGEGPVDPDDITTIPSVPDDTTTEPTVPKTEPTEPSKPTNPTVPKAETLKVGVNSNLCNEIKQTYSADEETVTVTVDLQSDKLIVDGEVYINYDPTKLKISDSNYDKNGNIAITPTLSAVGGEVVNPNYDNDTVAVIFTNLDKYDFTTSKTLVQITFDVIGTGDTTVEVDVNELDYLTDDNKELVVLVRDSIPEDIYDAICELKTSLSTPTVEIVDGDFLIGDVLKDSVINIKDVTEVLSHVTKLTTLKSTQLLAADSNGDGNVNVKDATNIQMYVANNGKTTTNVGKLYSELQDPTEPSQPTVPVTDPTKPTEPVTDPTEPVTDPTVPDSDTYMVYFKNTSNWSTPYIHYWNDYNTTTWPGNQMTFVSGDVYVYEVPKDMTGVIFNDGNGTQTDDLKMPTQDGMMFNYSTGGWSKYNGGNDDPTIPSSTTTVYFRNTSNWFTPYIHYWNDGNTTTWPGNQMTFVSDNVYKYEVPSDMTGVIFNDSNGTQTDDLAMPTQQNMIYDFGSGTWSQYNG